MRRLTPAIALVCAGPAWAHGAEDHEIGWTLGPGVLLPLAIALALYLAGLARLWRRSRRGRPELKRGALHFAIGWAVLAGALVSPLHEAGEVSFTMHMIEHELVMLIAALLLATSRPGPVLLWGFPSVVRRGLAPVVRMPFWRWLIAPVVATAIQAAIMVAWHMPALFDRALRSESLHIVQHVCFLTSAMLFWWAVLPRDAARAARLAGALCLFVTSVVGGGLGALMALDDSPWYSAYAAMATTPFGLTPAEDQQVAGLIMWVPGGAFHLTAALLVLWGALRSAPEGLHDRISDRHQTA